MADTLEPPERPEDKRVSQTGDHDKQWARFHDHRPWECKVCGRMVNADDVDEIINTYDGTAICLRHPHKRTAKYKPPGDGPSEPAPAPAPRAEESGYGKSDYSGGYGDDFPVRYEE